MKKKNILIFVKAVIYLLDGLLLNKILHDYQKRIEALELKTSGLTGQQAGLSERVDGLDRYQNEICKACLDFQEKHKA